jgi:serine/threonine protein kinase
VKTPTSQSEIIIARAGTSESVSYEILNILGEGASGITYRAKNVDTQQEVALKALSLSRIDDWKSLELFEREAQVLKTIDRAGIPKYIDYFHTDVNGDRYFYTALFRLVRYDRSPTSSRSRGSTSEIPYPIKLQTAVSSKN